MTTIRLVQWKQPGKAVLAVDNFAWNQLELTPAEHLELTRGVLGYLLATGKPEFPEVVRAVGECGGLQANSGPVSLLKRP